MNGDGGRRPMARRKHMNGDGGLRPMARRKKTRYSKEEWRNIFGQAARWCKENRDNMTIQQCMREYLKRYTATPVVLPR